MVSSSPVQLERGGGHLEPPSWCPHVGSQGWKPWESRQPRTLDTLDSGFLRVPADPHHPWPWGTSSTRPGYQHRRQGQRVHHMHASVHACLHRPHQHPHRGTGWLDVYTSYWPADTLMLYVGTRAPSAATCNGHTDTCAHAWSIPHPTPLLPALPVPFPARFDQGCSSCEHHTVREGIDLRDRASGGMQWPGLAGWGLPEARSHYPQGTGSSGLSAQPPPLRGVSKPHSGCLINAPEVSQALQSLSPEPGSPDKIRRPSHM